ncbi:putative quinol monooxygenase [Leeia sp.]|uniref:putative quinol monooxygenase n=1 Tax=Leeia sp. TaxID=2884678 RepID=UPI0035B46589
MPLSIVATIVAHPEHREAVGTALRDMLAPTRVEPGCQQYDLHVDQADPLCWVMIERWADAAALEAHLHSPHMARLQSAIAGKAAGIDIQRLDLIA